MGSNKPFQWEDIGINSAILKQILKHRNRKANTMFQYWKYSIFHHP